MLLLKKGFSVLQQSIFSSKRVIRRPMAQVSLDTIKQLKPRYLSITGGQLEYFQLGQGSPIVLIAGYACDVTSWNRHFLLKLAQQHQVIIFNNRNVGGSQFQSNDYDAAALAADTVQLVRGLQLKTPTIIGLSMGGMIALQFAVSYSNEVGRLILMNTILPGENAHHPDEKVQEELINMPKNMISLYLLSFRLFFPRSTILPVTVALIKDRFLPKNYNTPGFTDAVLTQQQSLVKKWSQDEETAQEISKLQMPTLILNGGADKVFPPDNSEILSQTILHAQLIRWAKGGHAMIFQYPVEIAIAITTFIARQD
jgi:pimeloyl-ACP methyl ester carboxylesterase